MIARCHRRKSERHGLPGDRLGIGEAVVDVGFVSDLGHARVLSWAAGKYMKAMIAPDADCYKRLLDNDQSAFNASTMSPFIVTDARDSTARVRSEEERRQGRLPLQLPVPAPGRSPKYPAYAVNMIDLPEDLVSQRP